MLMPLESKSAPLNPHMSQPPPSYSPPMPAPVPMAPMAQSSYMHQPHQAAKFAEPKTPAQIGEEYRAALFAQCAQGNHQSKTSYGVCGIITGVLLFPIGLICLFMDTEKKCERCGVKLD